MDKIISGLWQGAVVDEGKDRFGMVVNLTKTATISVLPGRIIIRYGITDGPMDDVDPNIIRWLARSISEWMDRGVKVLVVCGAGLNRSGMVVARTLIERGMLPGEAVGLIRARRQSALSNSSFVEWLMTESGSREV